MKEHLFTVGTAWQSGDFNKGISTKTHEGTFSAKPNMTISAAKTFKGDDAHLNPEELLLAALSSCHLMSYLYVCLKHNITVIKYDARTEGYLTFNSNESGSFTRAIIYPSVTVEQKIDESFARMLHTEANKLCFISNSLNFKVEIVSELMVK